MDRPLKLGKPKTSKDDDGHGHGDGNDEQSQTMHSDNNSHESVLLPGLPNHLALLCLSSIHPSLLFSVCHSWRRLIYSHSFRPFFSLYAILSPRWDLPTTFHQSDDKFHFFCFDPISSAWQPLPPPPSDPPLRLLHRHPSFIFRNLPIQSLTVRGQLVLVAATSDDFLPALPRPLVFDPLSNTWLFGPPLSAPRRWCATGSLGADVYVASGVGSHYQGDVARSLEKWDMKRRRQDWKWEKMAELKDGRFSREAVEAIGAKGKLFMVNVKGNAVKQGAVYDIASNRWEEMPEGMLAGWKGPAAAGDDERDIYMVDEVKGSLCRYDSENDCWEVLVEASEDLKGAEQMAAGRGRVCVVSAEGRRIAVAGPGRIWVVEPPPEMEVVAVHILPRMRKKD